MVHFRTYPLLIIMLLHVSLSSAQEGSDSTRVRKIGPVDAQFLFTYYSQEGDHSAVTGGIGSQELSNYSTKIILNIPVDTNTSISINGGVDYYTSASSDMINTLMSSASSADVRAYFGILMTKEYTLTKSYTLGFSGSSESDYLSAAFSGGWSITDENYLKGLNVSSRLFLDRWQIFFPDELRTAEIETVPGDRRRSAQINLNIWQVLTERLKIAGGLSVIMQQGLLSTPFHRVYFEGSSDAVIERLPEYRWSIPLYFKVRTYLVEEYLIMRTNLNLYADNFGMLSPAAQVEFLVKPKHYLSFGPSYRVYYQSASDYFAGYQIHKGGTEFYTSDFDLSQFHSHFVSFGISYAPALGVFNPTFPKNQYRAAWFRDISMRYGYYSRSDGLRAHTVTLVFGFLW